jgi:hypothetical protein
MKKYLLLFTIAVVAFVACRKTTDSGTISAADVSKISTSLTVWHGKNTKGTVPTNPGGSIILDSTQQTIVSYKGGYVVIHPNVQNGTVAGYYVQIDGANSYFKVDYSTSQQRPVLTQRPAIGAQQHQRVRRKFLSRPVDSTSNSADSAIVIQLPDNIAPGTFCMQYWAYDANGYTSAPVTVCVTIDQLGASDGSSWTGNWNITRYKYEPYDDGYDEYITDTTWHNNPYDTTNIDGYYKQFCVDGHLSYDSGSYYDPNTNQSITGPSEAILVPDIYWYNNFIFTLSANGAWTDKGSDGEKYYNGYYGSCDSLSYYYTKSEDSFSDIGGWSYNAGTNKFTIVEKDSIGSVEDTWVDEFDVLQKTANSFTIYEAQNGTYVFAKQ